MPRGVTTSRENNKTKVRIFSRDVDQVYGAVLRAQGSGRFAVLCEDGVERPCRLRGAMRRREWVNAEDVVLVSLRSDVAGGRGDILGRLSPAETHSTRRAGELRALDALLRSRAAAALGGGNIGDIVFCDDSDAEDTFIFGNDEDDEAEERAKSGKNGDTAAAAAAAAAAAVVDAVIDAI